MTPRPVVCVGAVSVWRDQLLVVERGHEPDTGRWSIPGGHVEPGELLAEAVVRELAEETGLEGTCGALVGWAERIGPQAHYLLMNFEVTVLDPRDPVAGTDAGRARWIPLADVADLALVDGLAEFLHDHGILRTIT
jgi:ADP-ribose pyrophosphatase YjhB (NUDIX family)